MGKNNSFDTLFAKETQKSFNVSTEVVKKPEEVMVTEPIKKEKTKETVSLNLRLNKAIYLGLKEFVEEEGGSLNQAINKAVKEFLKSNTNNN